MIIWGWITVDWFIIKVKTKANTNKSHLIVSKVNKGLSIKINNDTIDCSSEQKLLGVIIDNEIKFENHVKKLCKKSNQKLMS